MAPWPRRATIVLLFGRLVKGVVVNIDAKGGELVFEITEAKRPARKGRGRTPSGEEPERVPEPVE